jgi:enterobacterial common antigen flippase
MAELWRTILQTAGARTTSLILAVAFLSLTARLLGPEGRGQYVTVMSCVTLASALGHLSLGQVAIHRAATRKSPEWFGQVLGSLMLLAVGLAVLGWAAAALGYVWSGGRIMGGLPPMVAAFAFVAFPFLIWEQYGSSLLMATERIGIYNRAQIIGRSIALLILLVLVGAWKSGVSGAIGATVVGQMLVALGGIGYLWQQAKGVISPTSGEIAALLRGGAALHLNTLGTFAFGTIDVLILNFHAGAEQSAYYQLAVQLVGIMLLPPQAVAMVIYGRISALGPNEAWPLQRRVMLVTLGVVALGAVLGYILAPWLIDVVAGEQFLPSVGVFRALLPAVLAMTFAVMMAPQWIGRGYFLQAGVFSLGAAVAATLANLVLIPRYGMTGGVWSAVGSCLLSAFVQVGMVFFCNRQTWRRKLPAEPPIEPT